MYISMHIHIISYHICLKHIYELSKSYLDNISLISPIRILKSYEILPSHLHREAISNLFLIREWLALAKPRSSIHVAKPPNHMFPRPNLRGISGIIQLTVPYRSNLQSLPNPWPILPKGVLKGGFLIVPYA